MRTRYLLITLTTIVALTALAGGGCNKKRRVYVEAADVTTLTRNRPYLDLTFPETRFFTVELESDKIYQIQTTPSADLLQLVDSSGILITETREGVLTFSPTYSGVFTISVKPTNTAMLSLVVLDITSQEQPTSEDEEGEDDPETPDEGGDDHKNCWVRVKESGNWTKVFVKCKKPDHPGRGH